LLVLLVCSSRTRISGDSWINIILLFYYYEYQMKVYSTGRITVYFQLEKHIYRLTMNGCRLNWQGNSIRSTKKYYLKL
jgi:hypothetical protein